jgi:predicted nucleic acid-binding protein
VIAYIDSSVLLRVVLGQPGSLREWPGIERGVASALIEVECLRTIDRLRIRGQLDVRDAAERSEAIHRVLVELELVALTPAILRRASMPLAVPLGSLDAIHLASAELWREVHGGDLVVATHDDGLALACRASGLRVVGVKS